MPRQKTPTARTLEDLRKRGWVAQCVEQRVPHTHITRDLFGIIDVLALHPGLPVLGVQCTSRSNMAARVKKALAEPRLAAWLAAGCSFEVWGWGKVGPRGAKKTWQLRRHEIALADLPKDKEAIQ